MNKILFLTFYNIDESEGIWKKIESQVEAMRNIGFSVDFFYMDSGDIIYSNGVGLEKINPTFKHKYFFYYNVKEYLRLNKKEYDFVYVRKPHGGLFSLSLPALLKYTTHSQNIMEIPTYPYSNEIKTLKLKVSEMFFTISRLLYMKRLNRIVYFGKPVDKIWGVNAVGLSNGIDINKIRMTDRIAKENKEFTIVAVANLSFWHGYDRLIYGLKEYNGMRQVVCNIVGDLEPEYSRLREVAKECGVLDRVNFLGRLSGKDLDEIFSKADVCVDAVGRHRSGNDYNSSIKSKEYCARGLPFIKSHIDSAFDRNEFVYQAQAEDTPLNINDIITWRESLENGFEERERRFAEENLTWEIQFKKLFNLSK